MADLGGLVRRAVLSLYRMMDRHAGGRNHEGRNDTKRCTCRGGPYPEIRADRCNRCGGTIPGGA